MPVHIIHVLSIREHLELRCFRALLLSNIPVYQHAEHHVLESHVVDSLSKDAKIGQTWIANVIAVQVTGMDDVAVQPVRIRIEEYRVPFRFNYRLVGVEEVLVLQSAEVVRALGENFRVDPELDLAGTRDDLYERAVQTARNQYRRAFIRNRQ